MGRWHQRMRDQRGVNVVESAFVTPVFVFLVLAVGEVGLAMNDYLAEANAVRAGARVASASGNDTYADWGILQGVRSEAIALEQKKIKYIVVYKADAFGAAPTSTCQSGTPVANVCNVYTYSDLLRPKADFGCLATKDLDRYWCPTTRKVSLSGSGTDYVGVWMKIQHPWLTKLFGSTKTLTDSSVIRLEPRTQ
jgi:hypothetical protein